MSEELVELFRPVGQAELDLIAASGWREFPPRLSHQPIFYPVLSLEYAVQIARDWNTKDLASGFVGYVLRFQVNADFLKQFSVHRVGDLKHQEYWIPARDLPAFNAAIFGLIEIVNQFSRNPKRS